MSKIFGAHNIKRFIDKHGRPCLYDTSNNSIADKPHAGTREQQRRLRQQARKESKA
jgi:hypothetical protein